MYKPYHKTKNCNNFCSDCEKLEPLTYGIGNIVSFPLHQSPTHDLLKAARPAVFVTSLKTNCAAGCGSGWDAGC
eukprot:3441310-Amphidinium_carterae.1